jgi:hypothetical protein
MYDVFKYWIFINLVRENQLKKENKKCKSSLFSIQYLKIKKSVMSLKWIYIDENSLHSRFCDVNYKLETNLKYD